MVAAFKNGKEHPYLHDTVWDTWRTIDYLQSRPDVRWHASLRSIGELAELQLRIFGMGAAATCAGGILVYSVCTISRAEGPGVIDRFLARHDNFALDQRLQLLPHRDGTDGFFIARLRRM